MIDMNKKYHTRSGYAATVLTTTRIGSQPVVALVHIDGKDHIITYSEEGYFSDTRVSLQDLIEVRLYWDFKIDEPVMVRNIDGRWEKRHFAGVSEAGLPLIFTNGMTSWTSPEGGISAWSICLRPTDEELAE